MEEMVSGQFSDCYRGKRVLVTGHTGFKGSWLALWLESLGARVYGLALMPPSNPAHWSSLKIDCQDIRVDIRDYDKLFQSIAYIRPDIVFHLAAQPLVRRSYSSPLETWATNVMGTANLLEACRYIESVRAIVVVTSDKCYENLEWEWGYREVDRVGGHDPYSASKGGAELVVASYRRSYFSNENQSLLASARAGNVIGGGDWAEDRLIPDVVRSCSTGQELAIRSPNATRPWQHVLDSLAGYLLLGQHLMAGNRSFAEAWNFGPEPAGNRTVAEVISAVQNHWPLFKWRLDEHIEKHEANLLYLDSAKARKHLNWKSVWSFDRAVEQTIQWYRAYVEDGEVLSRFQLASFVNDAHELVTGRSHE